MRTMRCGALIVAFALSGLVATSCRGARPSFHGKWQKIGGTDTIEFFDDGRVALSDPLSSVAGSWDVLSDGRVKIEATALGTTVVTTGTVEGETLVLRSGDKVSRFESVVPLEQRRVVGNFADSAKGLTCEFRPDATYRCSGGGMDGVQGKYEFLSPDNLVAKKGAEIVAWAPWPNRDQECALHAVIVALPTNVPNVCPMLFRRAPEGLELLEARGDANWALVRSALLVNRK